MTTADLRVPTRMVHSLAAAIRIREQRLRRTERQIMVSARISADQYRRAHRGDLIGWDVEQRILALPPTPAYLLDRPAPSTGITRRLQALVAIGWPEDILAGALGWSRAVFAVRIEGRRSTRRASIAVCALYDQRWDWQPEDHGVPPKAAEDARRRAAQAGYDSPLAWDDDTIDNIKAKARHGTTELGDHDPAEILRALEGDRSVQLRKTHRRHAVEFGVRSRGMHPESIASSLGMSVDAVERAWERIKRDARDAGAAWPDDPRWVIQSYEWAMDERRRAAAARKAAA